MGTSLSKERYHYQVTDQTLTSLPRCPPGFSRFLAACDKNHRAHQPPAGG